MRRAAAGSASVVALAVGWPILLGDALFERDMLRVLMPAWQALRLWARSPLAGVLVPEVGNGAPLFVWPDTLAFHPLTWLLLPLPVSTAVTLFALLHLAGAAAATAWLAGTFRVRPLMAAACGVAFAASGTALDLVSHGYFVVGAATVPLVWAGCRRMALPKARRWGFCVVLLATVACMLGGEPQAAAVGAAIGALDLGVGTWQRTRSLREAGAAALNAAWAAAAALLMAMLAWAPSLAEMQLGARSGSLPRDDLLRFPLDAAHALGVVLPGLFSDVEVRGQLLGPLWAGPTWNAQPFLGAPLLAAALVGLWMRGNAALRAVAALSALVALGAATPVLPLLLKVVPLLDRFRYPAKYLLPATLAAILLAFLALQRGARRGARATQTQRRLALSAGACALGVAVLWLVVAGHPDVLGRALHDDADAAVAALTSRALVAIALCVAVAGLALARRVVAVAVAAVGCVLAASPEHIAWGPPLQDAGSSLSELAKLGTGHHAPVVCIDPVVETTVLQRAGLTARYARDLSARMLLSAETQLFDGLASPVPYSATLTPRTGYAAWDAFRRRDPNVIRGVGCDLWVGLPGPSTPELVRMDGSEVGLPPHTFDTLPVGVFSVRDPVPASVVIDAPQRVADEAAVMEHLAHSGSALQALRAVDDPLARLDHWPAAFDAPQAFVAWPTRDDATLTLPAGRPVVFSLNTRFLVGWRATQAGRVLPVVRAAGQFVAVVVEDPGAGPVALRYHAPQRGIGAALAAGGVLVGALGVHRARPRRQRKDRP